MPNLLAYDPAFAYELAVIIRDGMRRMYEDREDVFYYITLYNENYPMPPMPEGADEGILKGLYKLSRRAADGAKGRPQGPPPRQRLAAARGPARPGDPRRAVRRRRRRLERHQLQGAPPRRPGGRALEPAAPRPGAAQAATWTRCFEGEQGADHRRRPTT